MRPVILITKARPIALALQIHSLHRRERSLATHCFFGRCLLTIRITRHLERTAYSSTSAVPQNRLIALVTAMQPEKKRSSRRLSSIFSLGSSDQQDNSSSASSQSTGRLAKVKKRLSSGTHLSPDYPPPPAPAYHHASIPQPTIQPVESAPAALQVPPPLSNPRSRSSSPASYIPTERLLTANAGAGLSAPTDGNKKLRRRSKLFSGGQSSDEHIHDDGHDRPHAWVIGHRGKVPYNLALLLNGEKVRSTTRAPIELC